MENKKVYLVKCSIDFIEYVNDWIEKAFLDKSKAEKFVDEYNNNLNPPKLLLDVTQPAMNLETDFEGLKYKSLEGIDSYGKPKFYTETYAESDDLRIYIPDVITRDNTDIVLTLCFFGKNRRDVYHAFVEFITGHIVTYWDTCRDRKIRMVLTEAVAPSDDKLYGSTPYIEVPFKFKNCSSRSVKV